MCQMSYYRWMLPLADRFGKNLKKIRSKKGVSQFQLGIEINCTEDTIANYENGRRWPDVETIEALAMALDVDPEAFFSKLSFQDQEKAL